METSGNVSPEVFCFKVEFNQIILSPFGVFAKFACTKSFTYYETIP